MTDAWRTELRNYTIDADHQVHGPFAYDDWIDWAIEVEDFEVYQRLCIVGRTRIDGDCEVRTDFIRGIDLRLGRYDPSEPPLLFETLVFGGKHDQDIDRYSTWDEAVAGHAAMVAKVMSPVAQP